MDKKNLCHLASLLKRKKALQAIKDARQRSLKRKREEKPALTISEHGKLNAGNVEDINVDESNHTEIELRKFKRKGSVISHSCNNEPRSNFPPATPLTTDEKTETIAPNKKIKIISVLYKPPGLATFSKRKPSSQACESSLILMQSSLDMSTGSSSGSAPLPASDTPQAISSPCELQDDTHLAAPLPASDTPQAISCPCELQDDTQLTAPLPASGTPQAISSPCELQDDTHLTAPLPASGTPQAISSPCELQK